MTQEFFGVWDCAPCNVSVIKTALPSRVQETLFSPEVLHDQD